MSIKNAMTLETNRGLLIFIGVVLTDSGAEHVQANRDADLDKAIQVVKVPACCAGKAG